MNELDIRSNTQPKSFYQVQKDIEERQHQFEVNERLMDEIRNNEVEGYKKDTNSTLLIKFIVPDGLYYLELGWELLMALI